MPSLESFWKKNEKRGLHIFHLERQNNSREAVERFTRARKVTFPQVGESDGTFGSYDSSGKLPYAWVIGVDGKVIWEGTDGYKSIIDSELKKVRYPGLGKSDIAKGAAKAAAAFGKGQYGRAFVEAEKQAEGGDDEAKVDAQYIVGRVNAFLARKRSVFKEAKGNREFTRSATILQDLAKRFKGAPQGEELKKELKAFKKDAAVKAGLKAEAAWPGIQKLLDDEKRSNDKNRVVLEGFIKKHEGTKEAELAAQILETF